MAEHGLRLRPGVYDKVQAFLNEPTDRGLARRLCVSESTIVKAKRASESADYPAPMLFVAAVNRQAKWPIDALVMQARETSAQAA
ncbi:hypothetical protein ACUH96_00740 [Dermabacteraceae bacterium P13077]